MALEPGDPRHQGMRRYGSVVALSPRVLGRRLALTVAISLLISTEFYFQPLPAGGAGLGHDLWRWPLHAVECLWMGLAMMLALTFAEVAARGWPVGRAFALYATALLAGAFLGASMLIVVHGMGWGAFHARRFWADVCFWMAVGHGTATIHFLQQRASRAADELHRLQARRVALGRENLEARLNLMRAQIEPHFLFNALANVRRLCRDDVDAGIAMLRNLGRLPSRRVAADARRASRRWRRRRISSAPISASSRSAWARGCATSSRFPPNSPDTRFRR